MHILQIRIFPNLDEDPEWKMTKVSDEQTYFGSGICIYNLRTGIENMKILTITAQKPHSTGQRFLPYRNGKRFCGSRT